MPAIIGKGSDFENRQFPENSHPVTVHDFQDLFARYYIPVLKRVYFITRDKAAAEDITQEAFLKLYNSCPISLKSPNAWLHKVAMNLAYNYLRGEKGRRDKETREQLFLVKTDSSEEMFLRKEQKETVQAILQTLPPKEQMCLMLRFSGFSYEEIAEAVLMPKSSVGTTLARAQAKFKEAYFKQEGDDEL